MRTLFIGLSAAASLASMSVQADQLADIQSRKSLTCAVQSSTPPFGFIDPQTRNPSGHDVDLCRAIAEKIGVKAIIKPVATEARVAELISGKVDLAVANLAYTSVRAKQIQFSHAYYITSEVIVTPEERKHLTIADFRGLKLATPTGSTSESAAKSNSISTIAFHDTASSYLSVMQNKAAGFVTSNITAKYYVHKSQDSDKKLAIIKQPLAIEPIGVGIRKDQPQLTDEVNKALIALEDEGTLTSIWNHWVGPTTYYGLERKDKVTPLEDIAINPDI
ncbi:ABC transporter substrate-binding protein [Pseudomonas sp. LRP2-20]|uniref:transporter substrate-binding domain-containing protein n=1 Tax=Pseudomonas sp. LRP2-20 TaxID=2944234 RepID=UPI0021877868|nr:transporter substrate-binding domain-containing protein [Pseudomonas sp. LRP2-20]BDM22261.1 ABC transporter substrate-binding protein [Pseudomonas sp. LRP2-20]